MAHEDRGARPGDGERDVFINCPFDIDYRPMFDAIVFAILACGHRPRCALEIVDSGQPRIEKIMSLIGACRLGVHDLSRVETGANESPRFNMPFELGLFLGARRFGTEAQSRKSCLILEARQFLTQTVLSDLAGYDIVPHGNDPDLAIGAVRNWIDGSDPRNGPVLPGVSAITGLYRTYGDQLPALCSTLRLDTSELTYRDRLRLMAQWLADTGGVAVALDGL